MWGEKEKEGRSRIGNRGKSLRCHWVTQLPCALHLRSVCSSIFPLDLHPNAFSPPLSNTHVFKIMKSTIILLWCRRVGDWQFDFSLVSDKVLGAWSRRLRAILISIIQCFLNYPNKKTNKQTDREKCEISCKLYLLSMRPNSNNKRFYLCLLMDPSNTGVIFQTLTRLRH